MVVLTAKYCTKTYNARAKLLCFLLFVNVLIYRCVFVLVKSLTDYMVEPALHTICIQMYRDKRGYFFKPSLDHSFIKRYLEFVLNTVIGFKYCTRTVRCLHSQLTLINSYWKTTVEDEGSEKEYLTKVSRLRPLWSIFRHDTQISHGYVPTRVAWALSRRMMMKPLGMSTWAYSTSNH